jgi:hypothetical protein
MKTLWRTVVGAVALVVVLAVAGSPANAAGVTDHRAHLNKISATIYLNSWSTPTYTVGTYAENEVTVRSLGGACAFCYWYEQLRSGNGTNLYTSPSYFSPTTAISGVKHWSGRVYSEITVGAWTSASNIDFQTLTCC